MEFNAPNNSSKIEKGPAFYKQDPFTRTLYENEKITF